MCRNRAPKKRKKDKKNKKKVAERNHTRLCSLIDGWLLQEGEKSIDAASLMWELKTKSTYKGELKFLQSSRSMGRLLNRKEIFSILKKKGIHIETFPNKKGATYKFQRTLHKPYQEYQVMFHSGKYKHMYHQDNDQEVLLIQNHIELLLMH